MHHTKAIKRIAIMLLTTILVLGSSLTVFAATVTQTNPKTMGVQLIGNTLLINEDHHNFYIWGKSLMIQCPGVTDVLPNNNTKLIDVQFNGNLYKGIEEVLIVKTQGKDDKIRLEEGSMIVTGITTPGQVQEIKNAIKNQPANLSELKAAFINERVELGNTKNYIIGKNAVINESGIKINPKSIEGTVELIGVDQTVQSSSNTSEEKKSEPKKEEKNPISTPIPKKCTHQYLDESRSYVVCIKCGAKNPSTCSENHNWNTENGRCNNCDHFCYHKFPEGMTGVACEICGYNPSARPVPSAAPVCLHSLGFENIDDDNEYHKCNGCWDMLRHNYDAEGHCEDCGHTCNHDGATTGICGYCNKNLETTTCTHGSYDNFDSTYHKCSICEATFAHEWNDGHCNICDSDCPMCNGNGTIDEDGERCAVCGKTACSKDHAQYCEGWTCDICREPGKSGHYYVEGVCTDCNSTCPECNGNGVSGGCPTCHYDSSH